MKIQMAVRRQYGAHSVEDVVNSTLSALNSSDLVNSERPFYVVDIQDILKKHKNWTINMPRVRPFYAVKCNSLPIVLEVLSSLGIGFDCASKAEIDSVLDLGVPASDIIYANPCKTKSFIQHAYQVGVDMMTFDSEFELYKVAQSHPSAKLVLRIKVDDSHSVCRFSAKFGADVLDAGHLLAVAKELGLQVVGVSFHVGSGCEDAGSYAKAIADAHYAFTVGRSLGFDMTIVDLGGGWPGTSDAPIAFETIARVCNEALDMYFPEEDEFGYKTNYHIIAEPGRYYVASAFTLATMVASKKETRTDDGNKAMMYYLNDGVYGSFNCTIFDHWSVNPIPFLDESREAMRPVARQHYSTTLWGPTCDSMDLIKKDVMLPEMDIGEWIIFKEMGAYTIAAASTFNGFQLPDLKYHLPQHTLEAIRGGPSWSRIAKVVYESDSDEEDIEFMDSANNQHQTGSIEVDHVELIAVH
ncbi:Ornithine decarboxylase [Halotydeus destructor]|nr:Ornithine decarboxylase [Halotydeus destructor]